MHANETHFGDVMTITGAWHNCEFVDCELKLEGRVLLDGCIFVGNTQLTGAPTHATIKNCAADIREITDDTR